MQTKAYTEDSLGYDPKPEVSTWKGTPIPPVQNPIPTTPELERIARYMWWNGDPWTILRNRRKFLAHSMDWATDDDFHFLWKTFPRDEWVTVLQSLRPGEVSSRSYLLCMLVSGLLPPGSPIPSEWREVRHIKDKVYEHRRPLWEVRDALAAAKLKRKR